MKRLQVRIFLPILIVFLMFPMLTFMAFSVVSDSYFENMAERNTAYMARQVRGILSDTPDKLIRGLYDLQRENTEKTSVLVFNRKFELKYPSSLPQTPGIQKFVTESSSMIEEGTYKENEIMRVDLDDGSYMVEVLSFAKKEHPSRYIVCYSSIPNTGALMDSVWKLLLLITAFCLMLSAVVIWFMARSISRPIEKLSNKAEAIGGGDYEPINDRFGTFELEELKNSINHMAVELKASEETTISFFQNASHDLKTPLASISGYAQAIECGLAEDTKKAAAIILSESKRMTDLVNSILTISKLDNRTLKLDSVDIDLNEFLEDQAQILAGGTSKKIMIDGELPELKVEADPRLLTRIVQNIISNGLNYAEKEVRLGLEKDMDNAVITVEDDGPGISEEELPHIFERFYKGEKGGFGLGLSIAESGIIYMGGSITAENVKPPRHGARFIMRLPLKITG